MKLCNASPILSVLKICLSLTSRTVHSNFKRIRNAIKTIPWFFTQFQSWSAMYIAKPWPISVYIPCAIVSTFIDKIGRTCRDMCKWAISFPAFCFTLLHWEKFDVTQFRWIDQDLKMKLPPQASKPWNTCSECNYILMKL